MTTEYITFSKYCTNKNLNKMIEYYHKNKNKINLSKYNNYIFRYICEINNLKMLKWIYKLCKWKIKVNYTYDTSYDAFSYCCSKGYFNFIKYIYSVEDYINYDLLKAWVNAIIAEKLMLRTTLLVL